jgi:PleD family two-component response regulator
MTISQSITIEKGNKATSFEPGQSAPAHILVVDDEPEIGESLSEFLSRHEGYRVTRANNGQEAINTLQATVREGEPPVDTYECR